MEQCYITRHPVFANQYRCFTHDYTYVGDPMTRFIDRCPKANPAYREMKALLTDVVQTSNEQTECLAKTFLDKTGMRIMDVELVQEIEYTDKGFRYIWYCRRKV